MELLYHRTHRSSVFFKTFVMMNLSFACFGMDNDKRRPRPGCHSNDLGPPAAARDIVHAHPLVYPGINAPQRPPSELSVLVTPPNKHLPPRREDDDVAFPEGHVPDVVAVDPEVDGDGHVGEVREERPLAGAAAPAVEVAARSQGGERVAAGCDGDYGACREVIEPGYSVP